MINHLSNEKLQQLCSQLPKLSPNDFMQVNSLGEGAFGKVYSALYIPSKALVAIKLLDIVKIEQNQEQQSINRELDLLIEARQNQLKGICRFFGYFQQKNYLYFVSELCQGDLQQLLKKTQLQKISKCIISQIVVILEEMHSLGFCHRDVKPGNILFTEAGKCVLTDFGTSKRIPAEEVAMAQGKQSFVEKPFMKDDLQQERGASFVGTEMYLPPEMFSRQVMYSTPLDAYSFGCVVYEVLAGKPMPGLDKLDLKFFPGDQQELLRQLLERNPLLRLQGGWTYIKKLAFFKGVDFNELGNFNMKFLKEQKIGPKTQLQEIISFPSKNLRLNQFNFQFKQYLRKNEKIVEGVENIRFKNVKSCNLFFTDQFRLALIVDEKQQQFMSCLAEDFKFYEAPKGKLILKGENQEIVFDQLQKDQVQQIIEKIVYLMNFYSSTTITTCPLCEKLTFADRFCSDCGFFIMAFQKQKLQQFIELDCSVLPKQLKFRILQYQLQQQEQQVTIKPKGAKPVQVCNFADLFGGGEEQKAEAEVEKEEVQKIDEMLEQLYFNVPDDIEVDEDVFGDVMDYMKIQPETKQKESLQELIIVD